MVILFEFFFIREGWFKCLDFWDKIYFFEEI